jgi:hypothetical protein
MFKLALQLLVLVTAQLQNSKQLSDAFVQSHHFLTLGVCPHSHQQVSLITDLKLLLQVLQLFRELCDGCVLRSQCLGLLNPVQLFHLFHVNDRSLQILTPKLHVVAQRVELHIQVHDLVHYLLPELLEHVGQFTHFRHSLPKS